MIKEGVRNMNTVKKIICKVLIFLFIGTIIIISVGPLLWVLFSSFKTNKEILSGSLGLPAAFNFDNYADALKIAPIPQFYLNSIIVAVAATVLNVFLLSKMCIRDRYKVIVADDEDVIRKGIVYLIDWDKLNCEIVQECTDGLQVLKYLEKNTADIVITDIKMSKLSGIELMEEIDKKHKGLKMILVTAYTDFEFARTALRYGACLLYTSFKTNIMIMQK